MLNSFAYTCQFNGHPYRWLLGWVVTHWSGLRRARLVMGWVTVRWYTILVCNQSHPGLLSLTIPPWLLAEPLHIWTDWGKLGHWKLDQILVAADDYVQTHWTTRSWSSVSTSITGICGENFLSLWSHDSRTQKLNGEISWDASISKTE